ncbi:MAG: undecaprenyl-phosphate glucose phosphotransferase [Oligoflexus sp.]
MNQQNRQSLIKLEMLSDVIMISLAWIAAFYLRFYSVIEVPLGIPPQIMYFKLIPFIIVIWWASFLLSGVYRIASRHQSRLRRYLRIFQGCLVGTLGLIAFTYFYEEYRYSRLNLVVFAAVHPWLILLGRKLTRQLWKTYRRQAPSKHVLLIARQGGLQAVLDIARDASIGPSEITGVILPGNDSKQEDLDLCQRLGLKVFENPVSWSDFFVEQSTQAVLICLPYAYYQFLDENLDVIADQVADVKIVPDVLRYTRFAAGIDLIGDTPVVYLHESPLSGFNCFLKRSVDIIGALIALFIFAPVMLIISLIIPFSSPGPILYRQERMGLDGQRFDCLKFRSMPVDSEKGTGAVWATANDQRATRFGAFLRRTSLDELPQLLNVLKGEMSLVGPRPERPVFVNEFRSKVPGYMLRHKVKTGITGWAQVNGWRGSTSIHKRIECDLYYIQNWSIWLDIKILMMTIEEVFTGRNAY